MCQLNLTTIHYSGLRTRVQAPYFYLPLSTNPDTPYTIYSVPHPRCQSGIERVAHWQQLARSKSNYLLILSEWA